MRLPATLPLAAALVFGIATFPASTPAREVALPTSAANVWRVATKSGHSASACPVTNLGDGAWLFLTARHVVKGWVNGATNAIVEDRTKLRKLSILSVERHPTEDLAILRVQGDGKDVALLSIDLVGDDPGAVVYTVGYPGPTKGWFGYRGFLGMGSRSSSSHIERGMSGGALLDVGGLLSGIVVSHSYYWQWLGVRKLIRDKNGKVILDLDGQPFHDLTGKPSGWIKLDQHMPEQSYFVPLKGLEEWLRKHKVIE